MKTIFLVIWILASLGCDMSMSDVSAAKSAVGLNAPVKWEKGWKTNRVVAQYWPNAGIGYSLRFTFPENLYDADRGEVSDTFDDFDCSIYEGGGSPGAPAYATCDAVEDNAAADVKLKELLPALDTVLDKISHSSGPLPKSPKTAKREADAPKTTAEWIAKVNAKKEACKEDGWLVSGSYGYDSWSENCVNGVVIYSDTSRESRKLEDERSLHKSELANALVSRCLTAKEFKEATSYGYDLYTVNMVPYYEADMRARFNAALQTQQILQQRCPSTDH